jgi:hypothetical protein
LAFWQPQYHDVYVEFLKAGVRATHKEEEKAAFERVYLGWGHEDCREE